MRFLLKSIWALTGQAWDKEWSAEHSKLFSDWCSELREKRRVRRSNVHRGISARRSNVETHLCVRKFRVAPIRDTTIPQLELQAAVYGVRLRRQILREHDVRTDKIYHWTDSSTVLQWLQAAHKKQQVFVANRAAEILENSSMDQWRHVKGIENPADFGTRGMCIEGAKKSG